MKLSELSTMIDEAKTFAKAYDTDFDIQFSLAHDKTGKIHAFLEDVKEGMFLIDKEAAILAIQFKLE